MNGVLSPRDGESLKDFLLRARKARGLTRPQVSGLSGVHEATIWRAEPSEDVLRALSGALQVSLEAYLPKTGGVAPGGRFQVCWTCWKGSKVLPLPWTLPTAKFCFQCGGELGSKCPGCKADIAAPITLLSAKRCPQCGYEYRKGGTRGRREGDLQTKSKE